MPEVSIVVPVYNELENVDLMYQEIIMSLKNQRRSYEVVFVDDGSRDNTCEALREISKIDKRVKLVLLKRNFGQTAAMMAGIENAQGDSIVTIDGDLQNDPSDIPMMLDHLDQGFDLVHGWRKNRKDKTLSRKVPSTVANWIISRITNFPVHDLGCTLKAMRSDTAKQLELYGEMHRFIPVLAHQAGANCLEVVTRHRARQFGASKYGIDRTFRVILDLITVKFFSDYKSSPMQLLGMAGLIAGAMSTASSVIATAFWLTSTANAMVIPLLIIAVVTAATGVHMFALGVIAETCIRIYYSSNNKQSYHVQEYVNFVTAETETASPATSSQPQPDGQDSTTDQTDEGESEFPRLAA